MNKHFHKIILLSANLCIAGFSSNAQAWAWAKSSSGTGTDKGCSIKVDISGNVLTTGYFSSSVIAFGTNTISNSGGGDDVFIAKYNSNGNSIWAKSIGGTNSDRGNSICFDGSGNVFVTGKFNSPTMALGTNTLSSVSGFDVFLAKYDSNGNLLWAKSAGGSFLDVGESVTTDINGNVYVAGYYTSSIAFGTYTLVNSAGNTAAFLAKYDNNGNFLWVKGADGASSSYALSVSADGSGNTYITGDFGGSTMTLGTYTLTNTGTGGPIFLAKFDPNGNVLWFKGTFSTNYDIGFAVSSDLTGNSFITGHFQSASLIFGTDTIINPNPLANALFVVKYDSNGNPLWARTPGGSGLSDGYSITTYTGGVFVTGQFISAPITFGTYTLTIPVVFGYPTFIVQYDFNGNVICASSLATGADVENEISVDNVGNAYVTGGFQINPFSIGSNTLTLTGSENVYLAKYSCSVVGITETNQNSELKIFPNPNSGAFKLQIEKQIENGELILLNSLGQKIFDQRISQGENPIQTNSLSKGLYQYIILENKEHVYQGKIAIE